ncbi:hypothetical protein R6Q59_003993 [Mikania micrantha]
MTIDKSWIALGNWNSTAFKEGLLNFIEIAKNHEFFDLQSLQDEGLWEGVKLGINAKCAQSYKDCKQKAKKHFLANDGYENIEKANNSPPEYI